MIALLAALVSGCSSKPAFDLTSPVAPTADAKRVLVVLNSDSPDSGAIASYYVKKRGIPSSNVAIISAPDKEEVSLAEYKKSIEGPVQAQIKKSGHKIDFIVLTRGVPIRIAEGGFSVDGALVAMDLTMKPIGALSESEIKRALNPYFNKTEPFSHDKYNMYLVTRLTGYTVADAKRLVDDSLAAKPEKGLFFFDGASNRTGGGYSDMQDGMKAASKGLGANGFQTEYEDTSLFKDPKTPLAGYCSWGSNDDHFDVGAYRSLRFKPGALAETFVSTSGRSFDKKVLDGPGQSNICDLIADGVTGVKGYVSEPYTFALARPQVLFAHYVVLGQNLAESFYSASLVLKWKDLVVGDPLCAPYKK